MLDLFLSFLTSEITFSLDDDASDWTVRAALLQYHREKLYSVAYLSKKYCLAERNYSSHKKELLENF